LRQGSCPHWRTANDKIKTEKGKTSVNKNPTGVQDLLFTLLSFFPYGFEYKGKFFK
jgi:hypothetical protein